MLLSVIGHPFASRLTYCSSLVSQVELECVIHRSDDTKLLMNGCSVA